MRLDDFDTETRYTATVVSSTRITPQESDEEVRELILEIDEPDFTYEIGQSIGILLPGPHEFGQQHHFRLYTIADIPEKGPSGAPRITVAVRRCSYIDEYSGEQYKGVASNYLCDLKPEARLTITGPYGLPFEVPDDKDSDLLLIGMGTGIAPFRAFVKHIYQNVGDWRGKVRLFYGAKTGLEALYMNDEKNDFARYVDETTFEAFRALSPRPHWAEPVALEQALEDRQKEVWSMISKPNTHVYVAGLASLRPMLDKAFAKIAGSKEKWERRKAELVAGKRWVELIY